MSGRLGVLTFPSCDVLKGGGFPEALFTFFTPHAVACLKWPLISIILSILLSQNAYDQWFCSENEQLPAEGFWHISFKVWIDIRIVHTIKS